MQKCAHFFVYRKIKQLCEQLLRINTERMRTANSMESRAAEMLKMAFGNDTLEQTRKAMHNLLVLARDSEEGARRVWQAGLVVQQLLDVARDTERWNDDFAVDTMHILDELLKKRDRVSRRKSVF